MLRKVFAPLVCLCVLFPALAQEPILDNDEKKTLYTLGVLLSQRLGGYGLTDAEVHVIKSGLADGALNKELRVDMETFGPKIQPYLTERQGRAAGAEKEAGKLFREKMAKETGAETLASGLVYTSIKPGTGEMPKGTDTVKLHYHGTLRDGKVFDSSVQRETPAAFKLDAVIPCFEEGVTRMKIGGKSKLVCPPDIAYGDRGAPPSILPGATIVFDVELLEIVSVPASASAPAPAAAPTP